MKGLVMDLVSYHLISFQYQFFKCVWNMWRRFERFEMSVKMFGDLAVNQKKFAISNEQLITTDFSIDFSEITDIPNDNVQKLVTDKDTREGI